jgi:hypothetical protein
MKTIGIGAVATPASIGVVSGEERVSMYEAGIDDEVPELLAENKIDEAKSLMEKNNVRYTVTKNEYRTKDAINEVGEEYLKEEYKQDGPSVENIHDQDESETAIVLIHDEGDTWLAAASFDIVYGVFSGQESAAADDVMSLSWMTDAWQPAEASDNNLTFNDNQDAGSPITFPSGSFYEYNFEGVSRTVEYSQASSYNGVFQTYINRLNGTNEMVLYEFKNTYAYLPSSITSVSVGLPGGLSVTFSNDVDEWNLPASDTP